MCAVPKDMILGHVRAALRPAHVDPVEVREVLLTAMRLGHDPVMLYLETLESRPSEYEPAPPLTKALPESVLRWWQEREDEIDSELPEEEGAAELEDLNRQLEDGGILAAPVSRRDEQPLVEGAPPVVRPAHRGPRALTELFFAEQLVARRGGQWSMAAERGLPVGSGHARVVDLDGDAAELTRSLADATDAVADALELVTQNIATTLSVPSRFGGFTASLQVEGLRLQGSIYLNPLCAWHRATEEVATAMSDPRRAIRVRLGFPGPLEGLARRDREIYQTARNVVDVLIHEITHHQARHDAWTGDADFITFIHAYCQALRALVPTYGHLIGLVREAIDRVADRMEAPVLAYRQGLVRRATWMTDRRKELETLIQKTLADPKRASDIRVRLEPQLPSDEPLAFVLASRGKAILLELRQYWDSNDDQRHNGVFDPLGWPSDQPLIRSVKTFGAMTPVR